MVISEQYIKLDKKGSRQGYPNEPKQIIVREAQTTGIANTLRNEWEENLSNCGHYVIDNDGIVVGAIPPEEKARVTGPVINPYRKVFVNPNDSSIVIYLISKSNDGSFTSKQYESLAELIKMLKEKFSIKNENINSLFELTGENEPRQFKLTNDWQVLKNQL